MLFRKFSRKTTLLGIAVIALSGGAVWAVWPNAKTTPTPSTLTQTTSNQPEATPDDTTTPSKPGSEPATPGSNSQSNINSLEVSTNYSLDSQYVYVVAIVSDAKTGSCKLSFSKGSATLTDSKTIAEIPPYQGDYGCNLRINRPEAGSWSYTVNTTSGSKSGKSNSQTVKVD